MVGTISSMDISLSKCREIVKDKGDWRVTLYGVIKNWTQLSNWTGKQLVLWLKFQLRDISQWHNQDDNIGHSWLQFPSPEKRKVKVAQACLTLCDLLDCSLPGSSVRGILQAIILEWVPIPSSEELPAPGIEPGSPALQVDSFPAERPGKPHQKNN